MDNHRLIVAIDHCINSLNDVMHYPRSRSTPPNHNSMLSRTRRGFGAGQPDQDVNA
jgi:hypothetical protein